MVLYALNVLEFAFQHMVKLRFVSYRNFHEFKARCCFIKNEQLKIENFLK